MIVTILFSLVILLTLISVGKLLKIGDLINRVRNRESFEITENGITGMPSCACSCCSSDT